MNIDRLKELADTVEKGVVEFPEFKKLMAFNMWTYYRNVEHIQYATNWLIPERDDIPDRRACNACGCIMGFTILLFSPLRYRLIASPQELAKEADLYVECRLLLELNETQSWPLFHGNMDRQTTGETAARIIRRLILTGKVPAIW